MLAAITTLRSQPWADPDRILLLGLSTGGLAVLAAGADNPRGVIGIINFDGGRSGVTADGQPCGPDSLTKVTAILGQSARIPSFWIYAENDQFYGPEIAKRMFDAYRAHGAPAEFHLLDPFSSNGHDLIARAPAELWFPAMAPFLAERGLPNAMAITLPPLELVKAPPNLLPVCISGFNRYASMRWDSKAFAVSSRGGCGAAVERTRDDARAAAILNCRAHTHDESCRIYALGQTVVSADFDR